MTSDHVDPAVLRDRLYGRSDRSVRNAIEQIIAAGDGDVYAVGGVVRDLLLDRPTRDIDLVCEGDAIDRVRAAFSGERITTHARFRTACVVIDGTRIDVATARRERYERPGALPTIEEADINTDLSRRDFSVNAIALSLTNEPALVDPCGGASDVVAGVIRVLQNGSFRDDATRIFRAFRYAARLGFKIEQHTMSLIAGGLASIAGVSGARIRRELELTFTEPAGGAALSLADEAGALAAIHESLGWNERRTAALASRPTDVPPLPIGFVLLSAGADKEDAAAIVSRLRLRSDEGAGVRALASMQQTAQTLRRSGAKPSGVTVLLDRYPAAAVAAFAATSGDPIGERVALRYLAEWRFVRPILRGDDLIALGVPEGPQIQRGLQLIRAARLDGWAEDEGDERALALRFAKSIRDSGVMHSDVELHVNGH